MRPMTTEEYRETLLNLASEIHRICEEHNLVYVIQGGTLLGAKRHGGFIPWDDDFDIQMPRADYDMLVENFAEWTIHPEYKMYAPGLGNSPVHFAKLADTRTFVKQTYIDEKYCTGAWIDIFPLDSQTEKTPEVLKRVVWSKRLCYAVTTDKHNSATPLITAAKTVLQPVMRLFIDPLELAKRTDHLVRQQSVEVTDMLVLYMVTLRFVDDWVHRVPVDHVFNRELTKFEDRYYWGPTDFDGALTVEFGPDWHVPIQDEAHSDEVKRFFL